MDKWKWLIFAGLAVVVIGVIIFTKPETAQFDGDPAKVVADDRVYGNANAKVVLVEYADFQCPGCGALFPVIKQVKEQYKDQVAFVYRYLPLTSIHPNAKAAAAAAEAAARQGKFWEMHDVLYTNQVEWSDAAADRRGSFFEGYARQIGLNLDQYRTDIASAEVSQRISRDLAAAQKAGIQLSTPTVVLNGQTLQNSELSSGSANSSRFSADKLSQLLDERLKQAGVEPPARPQQ